MGIALLRSGQLDVVVAGGYDTLSEYVYAGFNSLRLVCAGAFVPVHAGSTGDETGRGIRDCCA